MWKRAKSSWLCGISLCLIGACASSGPPPDEDDIAAHIKAISSRYPASKTVDISGTQHRIKMFHSPRGYQTFLTLTEGTQRNNVSVWIYEKVQESQRLTLLVDESVDGHLDYVVSASAPSIRDAYALIRDRRSNPKTDVSSAQAIYDRLLQEVRIQAVQLASAN